MDKKSKNPSTQQVFPIDQNRRKGLVFVNPEHLRIRRSSRGDLLIYLGRICLTIPKSYIAKVLGDKEVA